MRSQGREIAPTKKRTNQVLDLPPRHFNDDPKHILRKRCILCVSEVLWDTSFYQVKAKSTSSRSGRKSLTSKDDKADLVERGSSPEKL